MRTVSETWNTLYETGTLESKAIINGAEYTDISAPAITRAAMQDAMSVGNVISASCVFSIRTTDAIPKSAKVEIKSRYVDGETVSEWLSMGTFYISKRVRDPITGVLMLECYDSLLKSNAVLTTVPWRNEDGEIITDGSGNPIEFTAAYPRVMTELLDDIMAVLGVTLDSRSVIRTGAIYTIESPTPSATIRDLLSLIGAANAGNWIMTPDNKLRLVPVVSADDAENAVTDVAEVTAVIGGLKLGDKRAVTGVQYTYGEDTLPVLIGDADGIVIDTRLSAAQAQALSEIVIGMTYQPYTMLNCRYNPAAEIGDFIRYSDDVSGVLYSEVANYGVQMNSDASAPDDGEISDEFPYIGASAKTLTVAKAYTVEKVEKATHDLDESLDQESIFNRLTNNGEEQGVILYDGKLYVNASYISTGTMSADHIRGGTLAVGGVNDIAGTISIYDSDGVKIGSIDRQGIRITGKIRSYAPNGNWAVLENGGLSFATAAGDGMMGFDYRTDERENRTVVGLHAHDPLHHETVLVLNSIQTSIHLSNREGITVNPGPARSLTLYGDVAVDEGASGTFDTVDGNEVRVQKGIVKYILKRSSYIPVENGGTGIGQAPYMLVNLESGSVANVFQESPRPGVTGVLPLSHGGTGANSAAGARTNLSVYSKDDVYSKDETDSAFAKLNLNFAASDNTWARIYEIVSQIDLNTNAMFTAQGAVSSVLTNGKLPILLKGVMCCTYKLTGTYDFFAFTGGTPQTTWVWRISGLTSADATPTVGTVYQYVSSEDGIVPIEKGGTGGATAAEARENLEVPMALQLTGTTWSALYAELTQIPIGHGALVNISDTAVTSVLSGGQYAYMCRGMIFRLPTAGNVYDIQMNIGTGILYSWRIEGLTSASATPTVDPLRRYAPFVWLSNNDTTWADLWNLLSVVPTSGTSTVYVNGTPATMITGGAIASACDGFVARYGSGLGFNFILVQHSTGKLFNVVVTFNSAHDNATVGTVYTYEPNTQTDISDQFTFADGWGGLIRAYKQNNIIELYVAISTTPTLAANTLYSSVITASGAAYGPIANVLAYASRSTTYNKKGADYMACFTHATKGGSIAISTGSTVGSGDIRFTMTYIANE